MPTRLVMAPTDPSLHVREGRASDDIDADGVLADPERLAVEHQKYRATVVRDYDAGPVSGPRRSPSCGMLGRRSRRNTGTRNGWSRPRKPTVAHGRARAAADWTPQQNEDIERGYARIREVGERTIIPAGVADIDDYPPGGK